MSVSTRKPVKKYAGEMGNVDRFDRNLALMRIRLHRAMLRYHRVIFLFYISAIVNNVMALMVFIFLEFEALQKSKEGTGVGYRHYFQNHLGNQIIAHGLKLAAKFWTKRAAIKVTAFMRLSLAKRRVADMRAARQKSLQRQSVVVKGRDFGVQGRGEMCHNYRTLLS